MSRDQLLALLFKQCHRLKIFELNSDDYSWVCVGDFMIYFTGFRVHYGRLTAEEHCRLGKALPRVETIHEYFFCHSTIVRDVLFKKSALIFLVEDFPRLIELQYHPAALEIDNLTVEWMSTGVTFPNYIEYMLTIDPFRHYGGINEPYSFPDSHPWWNIGKDVSMINGVPLEEAKLVFEMELKARKGL